MIEGDIHEWFFSHGVGCDVVKWEGLDSNQAYPAVPV